jgi:hypothetical protein
VRVSTKYIHFNTFNIFYSGANNNKILPSCSSNRMCNYKWRRCKWPRKCHFRQSRDAKFSKIFHARQPWWRLVSHGPPISIVFDVLHVVTCEIWDSHLWYRDTEDSTGWNQDIRFPSTIILFLQKNPIEMSITIQLITIFFFPVRNSRSVT